MSLDVEARWEASRSALEGWESVVLDVEAMGAEREMVSSWVARRSPVSCCSAACFAAASNCAESSAEDAEDELETDSDLERVDMVVLSLLF